MRVDTIQTVLAIPKTLSDVAMSVRQRDRWIVDHHLVRHNRRGRQLAVPEEHQHNMQQDQRN